MIKIPEKIAEDEGFSSVSCDICDNYDEIYECGFNVENTDYPKQDEDDYRAIILELVHCPETDTWTFEIIYNAYDDNWYASDDYDKCSGEGYKSFDNVAKASIKAYNGNIDDIRKFIQSVDNHIMKSEKEETA